LGALTLIFIIGIFILFIKVYLPPWSIRLVLKHDKPLNIRAWSTYEQAMHLQNYCNPEIPTQLIEGNTNGA
jgi:hypothetical protein